MKKIVTLIVGLYISLPIFAQIPSGYYSSADGLHGLKLKHSLHQIISNKHISWNYSHLPGFYPDMDSDEYYENDGTMLDIYSENPTGADPYNYDWETVELISGASTEGMGYNREHIVSQSFFYGCYPMYSDLHFVIPTDARVNQRRSNLPFGKVGSSPTFTSLNGTKVGLSISPGYTLTVFEPIDEFKGDIARMIFYAATRYEGLLSQFDTSNTRNPFYNNTEISVRPWLLNVLKEWHVLDPVSEREIDRNNKVYALQGNRNPFVDHPEYVNLIWGSPDTSDITAPDVPIYLNASVSGSTFLQMTWEPSDNPDLLGYEIMVDDEIIGRVKYNKYVISHLSPSTSYTIKVRSYDERYNFSEWSLPHNTSTESTDTFSKDIYFSKIIEGTGNNNAIEIKNNTGYTVNLSNYTIGMRQINSSTGSLYWSSNELRLEGELEHGKSIVIMHPQAELECLSVEEADIISASTPLLFDGILALRLNYLDNTIDMFGAPGNRDPFAVDQSLYRKESIKQPNTTFTYSEWDYYEVNYCTGLGNTSTKVFDIPNSIRFEIYPNPIQNSKELTIQFEKNEDLVQLKLVNLYGQLLIKQEYANVDKLNLSISNLPSGLYFLTINNTTKKIIVTD